MNAGLVLTISVFVVFGVVGAMYAWIVRLASLAVIKTASKTPPE